MKFFLLISSEVCEGYVFPRVCHSVHGGRRGGIPAYILGGILACLAACLGGGGGIPACLAGFQAHTQGGKLRGLARGGLQAHTQGKVEGSGLGGLLPRGCLLQGGLLWWGVGLPPPHDHYCCRRYASYWNAFLFFDFFSLSCSFSLSVNKPLGFLYIRVKAIIFFDLLPLTHCCSINTQTENNATDQKRRHFRSNINKPLCGMFV